MRPQHQVCRAHVVLAAVFEELDLQRCTRRSGFDGGRRKQACTERRPLTDFLTVVGQPSSNTGPLSVSLILNFREKLMGRM